MKKDIIDVAVIGGGASGLCAAISIKNLNRDTGVCIFEQLNRVGKKLITTGNGRCNITNRNIDFKRYHSENAQFFEYALTRYDNLYTENFFADLGVVFTYEEDKAFPYSLQASSVVDALRFGAEKRGVKTLTDTKVTDIKRTNGIYEITANGEKYFANAVIISAGLLSGGDKSGSNGSVIKILENSGYSTVKMTPSIVQLKTENTVTKSLKGIKVNAKATLILNGENLKEDTGEVLFTDYGLSGPPVMQISREVSRKKGEFYISLDLMPEYSFFNVCDLIAYRVSALRGSNLDEFFTGMLNKRVGQAVVKNAGLSLNSGVDKLRNSDVKRMADIIKNMRFKVLGTMGFENSQVTAGGLDTRNFDNTTMMSLRDRGLFCIGEILDVDGDCGGFNLKWAWSSAFCAAEGVTEYTEEQKW